jgi:hypothetical protein
VRRLLIVLPVLFLAACGGGDDTAAEPKDATAEAETVSEGEDDVDADEAAKRRESQIATWAANFSLTDEQATCLVDTVGWDALIASEQSPETVEQITECGADPSTFAGYGE